MSRDLTVDHSQLAVPRPLLAINLGFFKDKIHTLGLLVQLETLEPCNALMLINCGTFVRGV